MLHCVCLDYCKWKIASASPVLSTALKLFLFFRLHPIFKIHSSVIIPKHRNQPLRVINYKVCGLEARLLHVCKCSASHTHTHVRAYTGVSWSSLRWNPAVSHAVRTTPEPARPGRGS